MKKVGKNNPKAEHIEADNQVRVKWNQTVDRALVSGVPEEQILGVKQKEIGQKAKSSIKQFGSRPDLFQVIVTTAIIVLELLISALLKKAAECIERVIGDNVSVEPRMQDVPSEKQETKEKLKKSICYYSQLCCS